MNKPWNVILMIIDGHGKYTGNYDWGTVEFKNLKNRFDKLRLKDYGYATFDNASSPAVSTIMSIESILTGKYAAKTHLMHWREWPSWDQLMHLSITDYLLDKGYNVHGFSYLLNSENWMPSIYTYKPHLYKDFPSHKRDTHSHEAVLTAVKEYFTTDYKKEESVFLTIHTIFLFDIWDEIFQLFNRHNINDSNTIFILTSDHYFPKNFGRQWLLGERDKKLLFHHSDLSEYNIRVPLFINYPNCIPTEINDEVSGYDIAPTILDILGILPEYPNNFDGVSLLPLMEKGKIPLRFLRSDNVYPYQIGEKQGRITAVKHGDFKYIYRPDPISSYITYRLSEDWRLVSEKEEFYDLEKDPFESNNLVKTNKEEYKKELYLCKEFLTSSDEDIILTHTTSLLNVFKDKSIHKTLFDNIRKGKLLCIQSTHSLVFKTLINVLRKALPNWEIYILAKEKFVHEADFQKVTIYGENKKYTYERLIEICEPFLEEDFDCILNTSNHPIGDYDSVYDEKYYPVGDMETTKSLIKKMNSKKKITLCLSLDFETITTNALNKGVKQKLNNSKMLVKNNVIKYLWKLKYFLNVFKIKLQEQSPKIDKSLTDRIIDKFN